MKRSSEITGLEDTELRKRLNDLRRELIKFNAQVATGTVPKSPGLIRKTKRTVARILTAMRQRELQKLAPAKAKSASGGRTNA